MKILTVYPRKEDATSFYRGLSPFGELHRISDIECSITPTISWCELVGMDAMFFQRPFLPSHIDVINIAKNNNKPIIVDFDDLLMNIPEDNNFHRKYKDIDYEKTFEQILNIVDGVIFSTEYMYQYLKKKGVLKHDNVAIIPNAINNHIFSFDYNFSNFNKTILWRGSSTHTIDFVGYDVIINDIIKSNPDFTFVFIGYCPEHLKQNTNVLYVAPVDTIVYMNKIKALNPSLCFTMLKDIPFNRSKSNIAKIEATFGGAVSLTVDFEGWVWNENKDYYFNDNKDFRTKFISIIEKIRNKDQGIKDEYDFNYKYIIDNLLLSEVNRKRVEFINKVCNEYYNNKTIVR